MEAARLRLSTANWAGLHLDILFSILKKVRFIEDFFAFVSVCKSWREAASNNKQYLHPQIPWMMLPDQENNRQMCRLWKEEDVDVPQQFKDLTKLKKFLLLQNRLMRGLKSVEDVFEKECFGLNYGWILTVSRNGDMNLVHPLSRSQIELPNGNSIDNWLENPETYEHIKCAALSSNPSQTWKFTLTIVKGEKRLCLSYTSLGDKRWSQTLNQVPGTNWNDVTYYQDRFYGVDLGGRVWSCSVSNLQDSILIANLNLGKDESFLVGSDGDLLVVARSSRGLYLRCAFKVIRKFKVYKLDLIKGEHKEINNLGDKAIFIGHNTTTIVDHVFEFGRGLINVSELESGLIKPNHIYFSAGESTSYYSYNLEDGGFKILKAPTLEDGGGKMLKVPMSLGTSKRPMWYIPSLWELLLFRKAFSSSGASF